MSDGAGETEFLYVHVVAGALRAAVVCGVMCGGGERVSREVVCGGGEGVSGEVVCRGGNGVGRGEGGGDVGWRVCVGWSGCEWQAYLIGRKSHLFH